MDTGTGTPSYSRSNISWNGDSHIGEIWIPIEEFSCNNITDVSTGECETLVNFYNSTNGVDWITGTNWLSGTTICNNGGTGRYGIRCTDNHVIGINMIGSEENLYNNLSGTADLSGLTWLQSLNL